MSLRSLLSAVVICFFVLITFTTVRSQQRPVIESRFATLDQVKLHYLIAGKGEPVILLHGYAQTSRMWRPLMVELAKTHTVIAPDLRGFGRWSKPTSGYAKKTGVQRKYLVRRRPL